MLRCLSLTAVLVAAWLLPLMRQMPAPYEGRVAMDFEPERAELIPGGSKGSAVPPNFTGPFARNDRLKGATRLFSGKVAGPESVAVGPSGDLIMLDKFGYLFRAIPMGGSGRDFALAEGRPLYIGPGRPLGFHVVENGTALLVCDALKGLLHVNMLSGDIRILANRITATGEPINYANDLDVATDGTVYFTSSTAGTVSRHPGGFYDTMRSYMLNLMAGDATGQLLAWDPATKEVRSLLTGIYFANGVAVSADGAFVAVVETSNARVLRYWLQGPKRGTSDVLVDRLPGMPDGISASSTGGFWLALVAPLTPLQKLLAPHRWLRQLLSHVVMHAVPLVAKQWGCVVRLDGQGRPLEMFMDSDGKQVSTVSAVTESRDGRLFLGNLQGDFVSVFDLKG